MADRLTGRLGHFLRRGVWLVALAVAVPPPLLYFLKEYTEVVSRAEHDARLHALVVTQELGNGRALTVVEAGQVLARLRGVADEDVETELRDSAGARIAVDNPIDRPLVHRETVPLRVAGATVGSLSIGICYYDLLWETLALAVLSHLLAFGLIRPVGFRAVRAFEQIASDLERNEARFSKVIEATADGIWELDLISSRLVYVSPNLAAILGYDIATLLSPSFRVARLYPYVADQQILQQTLEAHIQLAVPYLCEVRVRTAGGDERWVRLRGTVSIDEQGVPLRLVGSLRDVTGEHEERQRVINTRDYLDHLLDALPVAVSVKDAGLRFTHVNAAFARMTGLTAAHIIGKTTAELYPAEVAEPIEAMDRAVLADGQPVLHEVRVHNERLKERRINLLQKLRSTGPDGELLVVGIHQDVTELRRALTRFEAMVQNTPLVVALSVDRDKNILSWNQAAEHCFGFTVRQARGRRLGDLLPVGSEGEVFYEAIDGVWTSGRARGPDEIMLTLADGRHWFLATLFPLIEEGDVREVVFMASEITARKQLEQELRSHRDHLEERVRQQTADLLLAKEAAERANQAKSDFLANMSHELRTPMHAVLSFASIGHARVGTADQVKQREYFEHIRVAGERLLEVVNDLLDLSKLEAGKMNYSMKRCDLAALVEEVRGQLAPLFDARQLRCELIVSTADPHLVGDRKRLGQVVGNLLGNAIKFSPERGLIQVTIAEDYLPCGRRASDAAQCEGLRLSVADAGPGIPPAEVESIFDKFTQSSLTRTGAGGTGLGLAICREIVLAHRGIITAHNRPEGGAQIDVLLPIHHEVSP